jgi:hypothetical protein
MKTTPGSPFHPTFGSTPPELAGRHSIIDTIASALDDGPGSAARGSLITGARGIGKTVTLNAVEDIAAQRGWVVLSESVSPGLGNRIVDERIPDAYASLAAPPGRKIAGVVLPSGLGGVTLTPPAPPAQPGLRDSLNRLIDVVEENGGSGVMLTLDEVHGKSGREDLVELAIQIQHLIRRDRNIALIAAGLPRSVQDLLDEDVTTFLRRAKRFRLRPLTRPDTEDALQIPITENGREIEPAALDAAVSATYGYPYLVQIVGDYAWKRAPADGPIRLEHVHWAIRRAVADMGTQVHASALHDLSAKDREFLHAMSIDDGPSKISDVADRLGKGLNYTSMYRQRLLAAEVVQVSGHGLLEFALPYLRDYLRSPGPGY